MKSKYKGIEQEELEIPEWHIRLVQQRLEEYSKNPDSAFDFDSALNEIEKEL